MRCMASTTGKCKDATTHQVSANTWSFFLERSLRSGDAAGLMLPLNCREDSRRPRVLPRLRFLLLGRGDISL